MQPVRIGVVGWGRFGRLHALSLAGLADAELAGVVARREESLSALPRKIRRRLGKIHGHRADRG